MPLKHGKANGVIASNIKELVAKGHDPKQAVAIALSHSRKMAEGGMVDEDEDGDLEQNRGLYELQADSSEPEDVSNPQEMKESLDFAKQLRSKDAGMGFAMGGLVEDEMDSALGNKPSEKMADSTEEPLAGEPKKPTEVEPAAMPMSEDMKMVLEEKKKKRRYM